MTRMIMYIECWFFIFVGFVFCYADWEKVLGTVTYGRWKNRYKLLKEAR